MHRRVGTLKRNLTRSQHVKTYRTENERGMNFVGIFDGTTAISWPGRSNFIWEKYTYVCICADEKKPLPDFFPTSRSPQKSQDSKKRQGQPHGTKVFRGRMIERRRNRKYKTTNACKLFSRLQQTIRTKESVYQLFLLFFNMRILDSNWRENHNMVT